jgi:hypothetical protein
MRIIMAKIEQLLIKKYKHKTQATNLLQYSPYLLTLLPTHAHITRFKNIVPYGKD